MYEAVKRGVLEGTCKQKNENMEQNMLGRVKTGEKKNPCAWNQISLDVIRQIYFGKNVLMPESVVVLQWKCDCNKFLKS